MADGEPDLEHNNKVRVRQFNNNVIVPEQLPLIPSLQPILHANLSLGLDAEEHPVHPPPPQILPTHLPDHLQVPLLPPLQTVLHNILKGAQLVVHHCEGVLLRTELQC
jgi:hypothetical protein